MAEWACLAARQESRGKDMRGGLIPAFAGALAVMLLGSLAAAQDQPTPPPPPPGQAAPADQAAAQLTPEQLDQLTAPIALYPDPLVGQILIAATYPLEVVEADRWLQQPANAALKGDQLAAALAQQPWDPSVKSLVAFPQILKMMDGNLTWTEQLGDAFLAAQPAVMDSVQRLRQKAEAAGKLKSTPQQVVSNDGGVILIEPPDPNSCYVPVYDPSVVYGTWPYPDYPPYYFPSFFPGVTIGPLGVGWLDVGIVASLWGWDRSDWRGHRIDIDANRFNALNLHHPPIASGAWQHDPSHRGGVPYRDPAVRARFQGAATPEARRGVRGFPAVAPAPLARPTGIAARPPAAISGRPPAPETERAPAAAAARPLAPQIERAPAAAAARAPAPQIERAPAAAAARAPAVLRPTPAVLQSFAPGPEVRAQAQRGQASRMSAPAPAPRAPAPAPRAPAPAARAAPAPQGKGEHK